MKRIPLLLVLLCSFVSLPAIATHASQPTQKAHVAKGRWRIKFLMDGLEKNVVITANAGGSASFSFLDTGLDDKPVSVAQAGAWSELTNNRISFSTEAELPIGTCCREIGTLVLKGNFTSENTIAGKLIFITSVDEEESLYKFRSIVGTFNAVRSPG